MSRTHVVLLRGVNVGGTNRLPMARLRELATDLGWREVATSIQSGNLVMAAGGDLEGPDDPADLAAALRAALADALGLEVDVLVLTRAEAVALDTECPWPEDDPRQVHAIVHPAALDAAARQALAEAVEAAASRGSRDEVEVRGRVAYLRTPDGFGRSVLAPLLERAAVRAATGRGTARNLASVRRIRDLVEG